MRRVVLLVVVTLVWMEVVLRAVDPWGVYHYNDLSLLAAAYKVDAQGNYYLPKGHYQLAHFEVTQVQDGVRRVPDSHGWCTVAFIGDSMTWGHGLNDGETWINLLAQRIPQMKAINLGVNGYNSEQVRLSIGRAPRAAFYVYLIISNDTQPSELPRRDPQMPYLYLYGRNIAYQLSSHDLYIVTDNTRFMHDIEAMAATGQVVFAATHDTLMHVYLQAWPVKWIDNPGDNRALRISFLDGHPNAQGAKVMVDALEPFIRHVLPRYCGEF